MTLRDSLAQVQELLGRATPGRWNHYESKYDGDVYMVQAAPPKMHVLCRYNGDGDGYTQQDVDNACAIAAAVNFLRTHGPELMKMLDRHGAGDAEAWLPIESAPRDGTYILLGYAGSHSEEGRWMGDASRNHWGETGWFASDDDVLCERPSKPTHWRPLPAPPTEGE